MNQKHPAGRGFKCHGLNRSGGTKVRGQARRLVGRHGERGPTDGPENSERGLPSASSVSCSEPSSSIFVRRRGEYSRDESGKFDLLTRLPLSHNLGYVKELSRCFH